MSPTVAFILLLLVFLAWVTLPFIPAIVELVRPRDAAPLSGVGNDSGDLTWFAEGFTRYAETSGLVRELDIRYGSALDEGTLAPAKFEPLTTFTLHDNTNVRVFRNASAARDLVSRPGVPRTGDNAPAGLEDVVVIDVASPLPDHLAVDSEVYARSAFLGGKGVRMRALLAAADATLAADTVVLRWVHARGILRAASGSALFGRATSDAEIRLAPGVQFERMHAPRIVTGSESDEFIPPQPADRVRGEPWARPMTDRITQMSPDTLRIQGDLVIPAGTVVPESLVIQGSLVLEQGARVLGSIKASRSIQLVGSNVVEGALTAREDIHIGEQSVVAGPIIGERALNMQSNSFAGTPNRPTTVTAPEITLASGVTIYGVTAARVSGHTV